MIGDNKSNHFYLIRLSYKFGGCISLLPYNILLLNRCIEDVRPEDHLNHENQPVTSISVHSDELIGHGL